MAGRSDAKFPCRGHHPQGGAGRRVAGALAVGAKAACHGDVGQVVFAIQVGGEATEFGAEIKQRHNRLSIVVQLGAVVELVASGLDVQSAPAVPEIGDADPEQFSLVNGQVLGAAGGAKAHVEDVHVVGPRVLAAHAKGIEICGRQRKRKEVETAQARLRCQPAPADAVVRRRGDQSCHAGAVIAQHRRQEWIIGLRALPHGGVEVV